MPVTHLPAKERKAQIIDHALREAARVGYLNVTREGIAKSAEISPALVTNYLGTMTKLRRSIMRHAVALEHLPVIAQGLASRDAQALKASAELRARAAASIAG